MFTQTTIPLVPTVTLPLYQFNLMKRALRAAWMFREHQLEDAKRNMASEDKIKELHRDLDAWRDLAYDLDS